MSGFRIYNTAYIMRLAVARRNQGSGFNV